ncbi:MAG: ferredoxin [Patescibacteria group bacterium]
MAKYKVTVDRDLCIGAGSCVAVAPQAFALDNEAKAIILPTVDNEDDTTLLESAKSCPVAAIIVTDETGKQVFP